MNEPSRVVLFDDNDDAEYLIPNSFRLERFAPEDISRSGKPGLDEKRTAFGEAVRLADLVLVDQELQLPDDLSDAVVDGASMIGILRSWARKHKAELPPLVILTNNDLAFQSEVPAIGLEAPLGDSFVGCEHRLAPALDVEWLLKKEPAAKVKIELLVEACRRTREVVGNDGTSLDELNELLAIPSVELWAQVAVEHVRRARPPLNQVGTSHREPASRGSTLVVRWLLHRAIPFAGMLLSDVHVAWTLNVTLESLRAYLSGAEEGQLRERLNKALYSGLLSGMASRRWWRAGVDDINRQLMDASERLGAFQAALDEMAGSGVLRAAPTRDSVVAYDERFTPTEVVPIEEAVELQVPGWPAEAMAPWAKLSEVRVDPLLASLADDDRTATPRE